MGAEDGADCDFFAEEVLGTVVGGRRDGMMARGARENNVVRL